MGRPSTYTPEFAEMICARIEAGEALATICRDEGMPGVRTVLQWADSREDFQTLYTCALAARAEHFMEEHDRIANTAIDRDSAAAARVKLTALEWKMSKMAPKRYGDRVDLNVEHTFDLAGEIARRRQQVVEGNERLGIAAPESSK